MNEEKQEELLEKDPDSFVEIELRQIKTVEYMLEYHSDELKENNPHLYDILEGLEYSQSREVDNDGDAVRKVLDSIREKGQTTAVTVIPSGIYYEELGGEIQILIEGCHRYEAILKLKKELDRR